MGMAARDDSKDVEVILHPGQATVFNDNRRFKVVTAGRRWGKSALSRTALIQQATATNRRKVWYVAPSYRMAKQIMWDELKYSLPKSWVRGKPHETDLAIRLINGSQIECKGADDPDALRGVGLNYVVLDEYQDMKRDVWTKALRPTLAKDRGGAMFLGTPKGFNLLYDVYQMGQSDTRKEWMSWQFQTIQSPFIPREEIEQAREDMDARSFAQEFLADFVSMSGRVYHEFDRFKHTGSYRFNDSLPIWVGQDFNVDPMTSVIMQFQPNGELWCVDEIFSPNSNVVETCDEIERRYWRHTDNIVLYPDPAGVSRGQTRGESNFDIFRQRGLGKIKFRKRHPRIVDRVNAVNRMLCDANGNIRLRIDKRCRKLIESLEQTMYKEGSPDIDKRPGIEHMTDALGYCIELEFPLRQIVVAGRSL